MGLAVGALVVVSARVAGATASSANSANPAMRWFIFMHKYLSWKPPNVKFVCHHRPLDSCNRLATKRLYLILRLAAGD
jgi:hypothetical protein